MIPRRAGMDPGESAVIQDKEVKRDKGGVYQWQVVTNKNG